MLQKIESQKVELQNNDITKIRCHKRLNHKILMLPKFDVTTDRIRKDRITKYDVVKVRCHKR